MPTVHVEDKDDLMSKLEEAGSMLVVVDFYATWCGPCKMISPIVEKMSKDYKNVVLFLKVDVEECEDLAAEYQVTSMPTFVFYKDMEKLEVFAGAKEARLKELVEKYK